MFIDRPRRRRRRHRLPSVDAAGALWWRYWRGLQHHRRHQDDRGRRAVTSNGQRITVSLRRNPSPVLSRICLCFLPGAANRQSAYSTVIAAHGGSVLVKITSNEGYRKPCASDYILYNYNNAVAGVDPPERPPSLYLLPRPPPYTSAKQQWRSLDISATGLVCHGRGEAEFVVAELKIVEFKDDVAAVAAAASPIAFELHLYRDRDGEWCVKRPRIIVGDNHGKAGDLLLGPWEAHAVLPLGDGLLCWVDRYLYHGLRGVIFSDVLDESTELRFVPYPAEVVSYSYRCFLCTNARGALKLVRLTPRRCPHCGCSQHATAVDTWTLKTDDMAWVLENETDMVNSTELWALEPRAGEGGYARVHLVYPVASMNGVGRHHVVLEESSAPTEEEVEHTAGN